MHQILLERLFFVLFKWPVPSDHPTLTPMSDQDRISPYNINIISTR